MTADQPRNPVPGLIAEWQRLRAEIRALEKAEHPDITDVDGRVWTWWKGDLYTTPRPDLYPVNEYRSEPGKSAVPLCMIRQG